MLISTAILKIRVKSLYDFRNLDHLFQQPRISSRATQQHVAGRRLPMPDIQVYLNPFHHIAVIYGETMSEVTFCHSINTTWHIISAHRIATCCISHHHCISTTRHIIRIHCIAAHCISQQQQIPAPKKPAEINMTPF